MNRVNHSPKHNTIAPDGHVKHLIMIADAHISPNRGNIEPFFAMLAALEDSTADIVFLGDIFDLWIALPRYENEHHRRFLAWCRKQKTRRDIGFIEGNHEFFLAQSHASEFSWCTQHSWWMNSNGKTFCHGDRINRHDRNYLAFRRLTKNVAAKYLIWGLPLGPRLVHRVKQGLKETNTAFRKTLPLDHLHTFAESRFAEGATHIFLGHFHQAYQYEGKQGGVLHTMPDWYSNGWISILKAGSGKLQQGPWQDVLSATDP